MPSSFASFRVLPGKTFGLYRAGEVFEERVDDAAPYIGTHLERVAGPPSVEAQLEAETGRDVVQTGTNPPTFVETDRPAQERGYLWTGAPANLADMSTAEVIEAAKAFTDEQRAALLEWEKAHKGRKTVLDALAKPTADPAPKGEPQSGSSG